MKKKTLVVGTIVISLIFLAEYVGIVALDNYISQKETAQLSEMFDNIDRNMAVKELSKLRGMILEVDSLSHEDLSEGLLLEELYDITESIHYHNEPYLKDFSFDIPASLGVRELCLELISQIDDQIRTIEYGAEGE